MKACPLTQILEYAEPVEPVLGGLPTFFDLCTATDKTGTGDFVYIEVSRVAATYLISGVIVMFGSAPGYLA